ncbi:mobilization protein MobC [Bisgaardia hudsonensis]|uniref:Mobilization protein MobC n=1 Tax=Bisgaardia hudsonensis TaxID=109472 RepID=A0A4R2MWS0_9PAST|nr:plasmid mobilization relaxosome protein MobC [Bisgaardia hudsonensis]TCP10793.1 mobilization protein MobC [Bisgaardia hudsonensis]
MTKEKRTKEIKIRLTESEYNALKERKTKARLAEWLRELALKQEPKKPLKAIDPKLLFELNRIGVNINQIARQCNNQAPNIDLISVLISLRNIEKNIQIIRENAR